MSPLLSIIILPLITNITPLEGVRNVDYQSSYGYEHSEPHGYGYTTAAPVPTPKLDCHAICPPENLDELNTCIRCMKRDESNKFYRCLMGFQDALNNSTLPENSPEHCHALGRYFNCATPILYRNCQQCVLRQFVKHHRPHAEMCQLVLLVMRQQNPNPGPMNDFFANEQFL